jgi:hypothetical protein
MDALATFRALAPEFSAKTDAEVTAMIEIANPHVTVRFGNFYEQALAYYAAHSFAMLALVSTAGSTGAGVVSGDVVSEKEGDLSRSYAQYNNDKKPDQLDRTYYGKEFKALAKKCIVTAMVR